MAERAKLIGSFFWLVSQPFWVPGGAPKEYWLIHWRCMQLLNQIGLTLSRIRQEVTEVKQLSFGEATTSASIQYLQLDEESFYRMVPTLVENIVALIPLFLKRGGMPDKRPATPSLLRQLLKRYQLDDKLAKYLDEEGNLKWYSDLKLKWRNPLTHVGSVRYVDASQVQNGAPIVVYTALLKYGKAQVPDVYQVGKDPDAAVADVRTVLAKLAALLSFYVSHFQKRVLELYSCPLPDASSVTFTAMPGFEEIKRWLEAGCA